MLADVGRGAAESGDGMALRCLVILAGQSMFTVCPQPLLHRLMIGCSGAPQCERYDQPLKDDYTCYPRVSYHSLESCHLCQDAHDVATHPVALI